MKDADPLEEARKRVTPFLKEEQWHQDTLPGMEDLHWCETCEWEPVIDHGKFEYGDPDE